MKIEGREIPDSLKCWCGYTAVFHHMSSTLRRDGKRTIWYRCNDGHKTYHEIQDGKERSIKESKPKSKVRMPSTTTETRKAE